MYNVYCRDKTVSAKNELRKYDLLGLLWRNSYSGSNHIGNMTSLFRILIPSDENDFCEKYFAYAEQHKDLPIKYRGLTYDEFVELVKSYMENANKLIVKQYDYDTYFNCVLCHVITETYDGKIQETEFMNFLRGLGYQCCYFEGDIDAKYGVDIKVIRNDGRVSAIQIKPITFFKSNRTDVVRDRMNICHKYENAYKELGIKTYYAIYKKDRMTGKVLWLKNGNGYRFKINELCSYDSNNIDTTFKDIPFVEDLHILGEV